MLLAVLVRYARHIGFRGTINKSDLIDFEEKTDQKNSLKIGRFLIENNDLRHVVRRAFISEKFPYSEIQDNTIGSNLMPIDMLRLKLSFFGAVKFDPKSDKWLRICMFQGAPLPNELKKFNDYWVYNSLN